MVIRCKRTAKVTKQVIRGSAESLEVRPDISQQRLEVLPMMIMCHYTT
jgi:hypothetical protein